MANTNRTVPTTNPAPIVPVMPSDFEIIGMSELPPVFKFAIDSILTGVVEFKDTVEITEGKRSEMRTYMIIDDGQDLHTLWESTTLIPLFTATEPGDTVWICFRGLADPKPNRNAMKKYDCGRIPGTPKVD